jgi:hypothetical protein
MLPFSAYLCLLALGASQGLPPEVVRGSWSQVALLTPGQRVEVHPFTGKRVRGQFRSSDTETLSIEAKSGQISFKRTDVRVLKVRRGSGRVRNAAIGAAIGGGIAGGITIAVLHRDLDDSLAVAIILVMAASGAAIGFAIGMIPAAYNTIYEVNRP